jgi:hypothetical protein
LRHDGDGTSQVRLRDGGNVYAVNADRTRIDIVEPLNQFRRKVQKS